MRRRRILSIVALLLSVSAVAAPNNRFAGTWRGKTKIPSVLLILVEQGNGLSGTTTLFSPTGRKQESAISDATVTGNTVKFTSLEMNFSLTLTGKDRAVLRGAAHELELEFQMIREEH
jgi:hypothetical protein